MNIMTSRERLLTAMNNKIPDRVPVAPDTSMYIPLKFSGLTDADFWMAPKGMPQWQAYLNVADHFGYDAWVAPVMTLPLINRNPEFERIESDYIDKTKDMLIRTTTIKTPDGDLTEEVICYRGDQEAQSVKLIKDISKDLRKFKHYKYIPDGIDTEKLDKLRQACHSRNYAFGVSIGYPGFHQWNSDINHGIQALTYIEMDDPKYLEEWFEWDMERGTKQMEFALKAGLDYILFAGSGTITLASPELAKKYAIPALKKWSKMAKDAGIATMLHSCGKSRALAEMLVADTDVGMLNPLETSPHGDVDLAEIKKNLGGQLAFMGNLHTTNVMLNGSTDLVVKKAIEAMHDGAKNGGFILSSADQCGPATPYENIFAIVETAKKYGRYDQATGLLPDLPL